MWWFKPDVAAMDVKTTANAEFNTLAVLKVNVTQVLDGIWLSRCDANADVIFH